MRLSSHLARIDVAAAVYAGIAAGIAATVVQLHRHLPVVRSFSRLDYRGGARGLRNRGGGRVSTGRRRPAAPGPALK